MKTLYKWLLCCSLLGCNTSVRITQDPPAPDVWVVRFSDANSFFETRLSHEPDYSTTGSIRFVLEQDLPFEIGSKVARGTEVILHGPYIVYKEK